MEYIKNGCEEKGEKCNFCNEHSWVGDPATRIPQPMPDKYNAEHFLPFEKKRHCWTKMVYAEHLMTCNHELT